jgi:hypothetical protein
MKVRVETELNCQAERAWGLVQQSGTLIHVCQPLARIESVGEPFPQKWTEKGVYHCESFLFGFIPVGKRRILLERVDSGKNEIQSRESDTLIERWDHLISINALGVDRCRYVDEIEIQAGAFTFLVWLWANWFYRHRQSRWRRLVSGN